MFNDNINNMLSKQIHREYEAQVFVSTRARSNRSAAEANIGKGLKKGMKNIVRANSEYAQDGKHLTTEWEKTLNKDNSIINTKKIRKVNEEKLLRSSGRLKLNSKDKDVKDFHKSTASSWNNLQLNETRSKLKISSKLSNENKVNVYATELSNNYVVSARKPHKCIRSPHSSSTNLSPTKKYSINSSKALTASRMLTLTGNSHPESQEGNIRFNNDNMILKLNVSDVVTSGYDSLNHNAATRCIKTRSKNVSLPNIKYNSEKCAEPVKMVLRPPKSKLVDLSPNIHNYFRCISKKRVSQLNGSNATLIKNCTTSVRGVTNMGQANNIDMTDAFQKNACIVKESIVLVQRLCNIVTIVTSPQSLSPSMVRIRVNDRFANFNINVSRKTYDSELRRVANTAMCHSKKTKNCGKIWQNVDSQHDNIENLCYALGNASEPLPEPVMSSTPKDQQGLNETVNKREARKIIHEWDTTMELNTCNTFLAQCEDYGSVKADKVQGEDNQQNRTYELIEPKTPNLRKRLQKGRSNGGKIGVEKNVKVRFTTPPMDTNCRLQYQAQYGEEEQRINLTNIKKRILKSPVSVRQRGINSVSGQDESAVASPTAYSKIYHTANSCAKVNIAATSQSVIHVRKPDPKYFSTAKKVPNFATIHRNMFTKSESVLDAKKRLRDRHTALTMAKVKNSMKMKPTSEDEKQLCSVSNTDSYNRFGFKIRKREATDCILRNNNIHVTRSKERSRAILKGVRTNRRFELQMKSRNIDL